MIQEEEGFFGTTTGKLSTQDITEDRENKILLQWQKRIFEVRNEGEKEIHAKYCKMLEWKLFTRVFELNIS